MSAAPETSSQPRALFLQGGWEGHKPDVVVSLFAGLLAAKGYETVVSTSLEVLDDAGALRSFDLIFPCWTMGKLEGDRQRNLVAAVRAGTGLAGVHGGMGDAFRGALDYEWMTGGLFVGHPHVGAYTVRVTRPEHPLVAGMPAEFHYESEQYYMLVDPGIEVLADTAYTYEGLTCRMPVIWTKHFGAGRVFYCSLGHNPAEFDTHPFVRDCVVRGMLWASRAAGHKA